MKHKTYFLCGPAAPVHWSTSGISTDLPLYCALSRTERSLTGTTETVYYSTYGYIYNTKTPISSLCLEVKNTPNRKSKNNNQIYVCPISSQMLNNAKQKYNSHQIWCCCHRTRLVSLEQSCCRCHPLLDI